MDFFLLWAVRIFLKKRSNKSKGRKNVWHGNWHVWNAKCKCLPYCCYMTNLEICGLPHTVEICDCLFSSNATTAAHWGTEASAVSAPAAVQWQHQQQCKRTVGSPVTWPDWTDRHWAGGLRCQIRHNPWRSTRMTWLVHIKCQVQT